MSVKVMCITTVDFGMRFLAFDHLQQLQRCGYDVLGVCAYGRYVNEMARAGLRLQHLPLTRRVTPMHDLRMLGALVALMRCERPDLVHTHTPKANLLGQLAAAIVGVRARVSTVHGLYVTEATAPLKRQMWLALERLSARFAHRVFLINEEDVALARARHICRADQIQLLPAGIGIDLQRFDPRTISPAARLATRSALGIDADALVVGFVGRLVREKGLEELFAACAQLARRCPQLRLLVIGPADVDKGDVVTAAAAARHGITARCVFTGPRTDTPELYAAMDIFALPSFREGMPVSLMEAHAMGLPSVATNVRGCRDVCVHNETGLLVPLGDVGTLARTLALLAGNAALRRQLGSAARQRAMARFSQQVAFQHYERAYAELLAPGARPLPAARLRGPDDGACKTGP